MLALLRNLCSSFCLIELEQDQSNSQQKKIIMWELNETNSRVTITCLSTMQQIVDTGVNIRSYKKSDRSEFWSYEQQIGSNKTIQQQKRWIIKKIWGEISIYKFIPE